MPASTLTPGFCKRGHPRTPENTGHGGSCRLCKSSYARKRYTEQKPRIAENNARWAGKNPDRKREHIRTYSRTLKGKIARLRSTAKARGHAFDLSVPELQALSQQPCFYCGGALPETHLGLDRIDNDLGYVSGNVLPCCTDCNLHRGATWTVNEAKVAIEAVRRFRKKQAA